MLLLILTAGALIVAVGRGAFTRPFHWIDAAVGILVLVCITSAVIGVLVTLFRAGDNPEINQRISSPRFAINMAWEWLGFGLIYFLARQLIASERETRAVVTVMVALAVVLSALGLYQVFVVLPADRAAYEANPDEVLLETGSWWPPGSPERARFEDRLNSTEPLATFALANSLAGYLAPWLVVALGIAWNLVQDRLPGPARAKTVAGRWRTGRGDRLDPGVPRTDQEPQRVLGVVGRFGPVAICQRYVPPGGELEVGGRGRRGAGDRFRRRGHGRGIGRPGAFRSLEIARLSLRVLAVHARSDRPLPDLGRRARRVPGLLHAVQTAPGQRGNSRSAQFPARALGHRRHARPVGHLGHPGRVRLARVGAVAAGGGADRCGRRQIPHRHGRRSWHDRWNAACCSRRRRWRCRWRFAPGCPSAFICPARNWRLPCWSAER